MQAVHENTEQESLTLWSIRDALELDALSVTGALRTDPRMVEDEFRPAYDWIARKLAEKLRPPAGIAYPVWSWYRADGQRKPRPDLRRKWGETGQDMALVEFSMPASDVLLSDYQTWHFPLNDWFLGRSEKEQDGFERDEAALDPAMRRARVEASWDAVLNWHALDAAWHGVPDDMQIQAVTWEIPSHAIHSIRTFRSR